MPEEVRALTEELHAVRESLDRVLGRLEAIEEHNAAIAAQAADIKKQTTRERRRAWWHRGVSLALVVAFALLAVVAAEQYRARSEGCEAIRDAFDTYTDALAAFSSASADRNPDEQARFDARVDVFRAEIATRLADCS